MGTLIEDIPQMTKWIITCFDSDRINLDCSIESFYYLDKFMDENSLNPGLVKPGGRLSNNAGQIFFAIGCYIGDTMIKNIKGSSWVTDDSEKDETICATVKLPDGTIIFPMQRVMKRFYNGPEDGIEFYGKVLIREFSK